MSHDSRSAKSRGDRGCHLRLQTCIDAGNLHTRTCMRMRDWVRSEVRGRMRLAMGAASFAVGTCGGLHGLTHSCSPRAGGGMAPAR